ncbi:MAG: hypothetical protein ACQESC_02190 [Nanobdellota archaeon]
MTMNQQRKGQVTVFVILGAVILISVGLFIFLNKDIQSDKPAVDIPDVSLESRPVNELITQCLEQTSKEALFKVGMQGGYARQLEATTPSYRGKALDYTPFTVPFWRHLTGEDCSNPSGCSATEQPRLCSEISDTCTYVSSSRTSSSSVEENLEQYVLENIDSCIDGFSSLEDQYAISTTDRPEVNVVLANGKTDFVLNYPIEIESLIQEGNSKEIERFRASFDVDLVSMYELADQIMSYEREYNIYEYKTLDLLNTYASLESKIPPTSEISVLQSNHGPWILSEVKQLLETEVLPYMMLMSVVNTDNPMFIDRDNESDPYSQYISGYYKGFSFATSQKLFDFDVRHSYTYSPIHLLIGSGGELIEGEDFSVPDDSKAGMVSTIISDFMNIGLTDYRFAYDISYPLVIEIDDSDAFNGEGYTFQFATEVNIRNNEPGFQNFTTVTQPTRLKSNPGEYQFRPEQNITVEVFDKRTGEPIELASVDYVCGDKYSVGTTTLVGDKAVVSNRFPYCQFGGSIVVDAFNYSGTSIDFNNVDGGSNEQFSIGLWPIKTKDVRVKARSPRDIITLNNDPQNFLLNYRSSAHNLSEFQQAYLTIQKEKTSPYDEQIPAVGFAQFKGKSSSLAQQHSSLSQTDIVDELMEEADMSSADLTDEEQVEIGSALDQYQENSSLHSDENEESALTQELELVPGNYSFDISLLYYNELSFENYSKGKEEYPALNLSTWAQGMNNFTFSLSEEEVYGNTSITFFVLETPLPFTWKEEQMADLCDDENSSIHRHYDASNPNELILFYSAEFGGVDHLFADDGRILINDSSHPHCDLLALYSHGFITTMTQVISPEDYSAGMDDFIKPLVVEDDS